MIAKELLSPHIHPLEPKDKVSEAISVMEELKIHHLPIVYKQKLQGVVADFDLTDLKNSEEILAHIEMQENRAFIDGYEHIYEAIRLMQKHKVTVLPVVDDEQLYVGCISQTDLFRTFSAMTSFEQSGGVIVLELNTNDYVMSEIAQIVESANAKILSTYLTLKDNSTRLEVTLKVNRTDLQEIILAFERYEYSIKASFSETEPDEVFQDRVDSLMRYLNV